MREHSVVGGKVVDAKVNKLCRVRDLIKVDLVDSVGWLVVIRVETSEEERDGDS